MKKQNEKLLFTVVVSSNERFRLHFLSEIEKYLDCSFSSFHSIFISVLDEHPPLNEKYISAKDFMRKELYQAIMISLKL